MVCLPCFAAGMRDDTVRLAARLASLRGTELSAAEFAPLQSEYLGWLDVRVQARATVQMMNVELEEAKLLLKDSATPENPIDRNNAGYLDKVQEEFVGQDMLALKLWIYTGDNCNQDETLILYQREPLRRLGWLNAEQSYHHGHYLHGVAGRLGIGKDEKTQTRLIGSAWTASNCTSIWNGGNFRIDIMRSGGVTHVLDTQVLARDDDEVKITIENNAVTFRYFTGMHDTILNGRDGIASYRIENGKPIRQAPIASQFGGFIDEWLLLDDADAARVSSAAAARPHHEIAAKFEKEPFDWQHVADCPGPAREIAVRGDETEKVTVFLIASSSIADMRMLSISDKINPSCREIDISKDLSPITSGPSH